MLRRMVNKRWLLLLLLAATALVCRPAVAEETAAAIRLNTIGFLPEGAKQASVAAPCEAFTVVRCDDGQVVFTGSASGPRRNEDTGEQLFTADFSPLDEPGRYRLEVPGVGRSAPFRIAADLYAQPFRLAMRAFYLWRCGTAVRGEHGSEVFEQAACHLDDAYLDRVGHAGQRRDAAGGWHDAGDYNKYVANAGVTVGCLFRAWEDFQPRLEAIEWDLPESDGPLPDFLAELKWEIDWLFKMQADDGSVHHKVSSPHYCGFIMPSAETDRRYFGEWGSTATADFVAMMALAARHFRPYEPQYADRCLAAARKSYAFLQAHPQDHPPGQKGFQTGGYTSSDWDDRLWAAAELWETTGDAEPLADFEARAAALQPQRRRRNQPGQGQRPRQRQFAANWDWADVHNLGLITYLQSQRPGRDAELVAQIRHSLVETADRIVATSDEHGYDRPLGDRYYWGCNGTVARQAVLLSAAHRAAADDSYRAATIAALDHLFGRNCHGRSYATGLGHRPPRFPHDRRSAADQVAAPWPGYLVGGPERDAGNWNDDQNDYRTNEIAINWNAALVYALASVLDDPQ